MEEKSREQEMSAREISLIRELAQIRKEYKRELEYEKFDGYELPPRTQFSMLNKPAVSIKYGVMKFNMACIRLFEGIKYVLPILHPNKKRLALIMCPEEDSASVEWARQKDENWVNKDITSLEFVENIFKIMSWNRECRYKILGRVANSDQGLCMLFDLEEAIMFTPKPQEYTDPVTGETKKKQIKFFPDVYKDRIGKSYTDYIAGHQMNLFEDFIGYQGSAVLDETEREAGTTSVPIPQGEDSENTPLGFDGEATRKMSAFLQGPKPERLHRQKFFENGTAERAKESGTEQNYNMIDSCVNNVPKKPRRIGGRWSVLDRLHIKQAERRQKDNAPQQEQERSRKS